MYKRKILSTRFMAIFIIAVFLISCAFGCKESLSVELPERSFRQNSGCFSVHYLDVGQGDCILIHFPDGKSMLIDSGNGENQNNEYILNFLKEFSVGDIDYLVITHPDVDHMGGAKNIIASHNVKNAFLSKILVPENFPEFKTVKDYLTMDGAVINVSETYRHVKGKDYSVAFLSPFALDFPNVESGYVGINGEYPTDADVNNASPIIYVEYKGIRFLFTGDAGSAQERIFLQNEHAILKTFKQIGLQINLDYVDFLKVSHHGANSGTSVEFSDRIRAKNAVISVGGENKYGHPSTEVLKRLAQSNPAHNVYRTDVHGTISVLVSEKGEISIITDKTQEQPT